MTFRQLVVGALLMAAIIGGWVAFNLSRTSAEARLEARRDWLSRPIAIPRRAPLVGANPNPCRSGGEVAEAVRDVQPAPADVAAVQTFVARPDPTTAAAAWPALERLEPVIDGLLDTAYCGLLSPIPPEERDRVRQVAPLVAGKARALAFGGDEAGALRVSLEAWMFALDLQDTGDLAAYAAGLDAIEPVQAVIAEVLVSGGVPPRDLGRAAAQMGHFLHRSRPLTLTIERERHDRAARLFFERPADVSAAALEATLVAYDADMEALASALAVAVPDREAALARWAAAPPADALAAAMRPDGAFVAATQRRAVATLERGRGLVLLGALAAWRTRHPECPLSPDAAAEAVPRDTLKDVIEAETLVYDPASCSVAVVVGGETIARWSLAESS